MVNLPSPEAQAGRAVGERGSDRPGTRSHHQWGARYGRRREEMRTRMLPTSLCELEELAKRAVTLMEKHSPKSDKNFKKAMDLLRIQYNLNFTILCEKCGGTHNCDELDAPER